MAEFESYCNSFAKASGRLNPPTAAVRNRGKLKTELWKAPVEIVKTPDQARCETTAPVNEKLALTNP
jgi:hypothetical protein